MARYREMAEVGAEIGRLLRRAGLEQKDLARRLDIHESSVSRLLSGQRGLAVDELYRVADLFSVRAETIVMEEEDEPALLRAAAAGDQEIERCLDSFDSAIEDYFSAKALERFL